MDFQKLFFALFFILMSLLLINGQRPVNNGQRRRIHRHNCFLKRCMPLHSRVPFP
ncbi:apelin receptor early endogenous ligand [Spea bombifrons]|uniref:apelin receptor early endogenous ligand n=1 Tax=Spea bombifrons TaxID=233779 RepID=UPI00234BF06F|nr:apelin receptor early endogenous ligand [Spea bombifrons]